MSRDDLLRAHLGDQPPHRLAFRLGPQIPHRVDDRAGGEMHHALVGADPAQLAVAGDVAPEARRIFADPVEFEPDDQRRERLDRGAAHLVAAADGEGQSVAGEPGGVGLEDAHRPPNNRDRGFIASEPSR